uniref:Secreted protein n=1 Tax=Anopheles darlingi TaxID=43151 RepID=A0A2M4DQV3_ANODA
MQFNIILQSLSVSAALLPSLQAQYTLGPVSCPCVGGVEGTLAFGLLRFSLSFPPRVRLSATHLGSLSCFGVPSLSVGAGCVPESTMVAVVIGGVLFGLGVCWWLRVLRHQP